MKIIVFLALISIFAHHVAALCIGNDFISAKDECLAASGGDKNMLERFSKIKKSLSPEENCFRFCMMNRCDYLDVSGNIGPNMYKQYIEPFTSGKAALVKAMSDAFETCQKIQQSEDKCTTATLFMECLANSCKGCVFDLSRQLSGKAKIT